MMILISKRSSRVIMGNNNSSKKKENNTPTKMELKEIRENVEGIIRDNKIVVFSKTYCPYALKAKTTLDQLTKSYVVIELNGHPQGTEIQEILGQITGASTVPRVFIGGVCIGGGDDTARLYKSGELAKMIE